MLFRKKMVIKKCFMPMLMIKGCPTDIDSETDHISVVKAVTYVYTRDEMKRGWKQK